jgi:hypothetical protein
MESLPALCIGTRFSHTSLLQAFKLTHLPPFVHFLCPLLILALRFVFGDVCCCILLCCVVLCCVVGSGDVSRVDWLCEQMHKENSRPDQITYHSILNAMANAGKPHTP